MDVRKARASLQPTLTPRGPPTGTVEASLDANRGLVSLENVDIPNNTRVNGTIPIAYGIENNASFIGPFDPDVCTDTGVVLPKNGYDLTVEFAVGGSVQDSARWCIAYGENRAGEASVRAPSTAGEVEVELRLRATDTGNIQDRVSRTVTVAESDDDVDFGPCPRGFERDPATGDCVPTGDFGGGGIGGGGGGIDDLLPGGVVRDFGILVVLLVILLAAVGQATG